MVILVNTTALRQLEQEVIDSAARIKVHQALMQQREQERMQIARDLHDGPLQDLIAASYTVRASIDEVADPSAAGTLTQLLETLRAQNNGIRAFAYELRPPALARAGFDRAIAAQIELVQDKNPGLTIQSSLEPVEEYLSEAERLALFRICQEALNNVIKHAHATRVQVKLIRLGSAVELVVVDNGVGFTVPRDLAEFAAGGHLGVLGLRERAEAAGGGVQIFSRPGKGTQVIVTIPILDAR